MGGIPSFMIPQQLPAPEKYYTPKSIAKHDEIEEDLKRLLIHGTKVLFSKIVPITVAVARVAGFPANIPNYIVLLKSVIDALCGSNAIENITQLKEIVKGEIAKSALADISSHVGTIQSRLNEILDDETSDNDKRIKTEIAVNTCEKVFYLFDNPDYVLWKIGVTSSAMLLPFAKMFASLIKFCYENRERKEETPKCLKIHKARLISVLNDYKKQCVLDRLSYVVVVTADTCIYSEGISTHHYNLGHVKFETDRDKDLKAEFHRSYHCVDAWDNWEERMTTYESIIGYRKTLISLYEEDFDDIIGTVNDQLKDIDTTGVDLEMARKEFCKQKATWSFVSC